MWNLFKPVRPKTDEELFQEMDARFKTALEEEIAARMLRGNTKKDAVASQHDLAKYYDQRPDRRHIGPADTPAPGWGLRPGRPGFTKDW